MYGFQCGKIPLQGTGTMLKPVVWLQHTPVCNFVPCTQLISRLHALQKLVRMSTVSLLKLYFVRDFRIPLLFTFSLWPHTVQNLWT